MASGSSVKVARRRGGQFAGNRQPATKDGLLAWAHQAAGSCRCRRPVRL
jgi:hypothetical protein